MDIDFDTIFKNIEENNLSHGIFFLIYLIGSKYVFKNVPKTIRNLFELFLIRTLVIFSASFVATKNTRNAIILTIVYIIIFEFTFNPKSVFCLTGCKPQKNKEEIDVAINNQTIIQQQQPAPQQQQIQTQLPPLQMDMNQQMSQGPMAFGIENFSNY